MVSVHIICVGKMKEKFYLEAAAEYAKRLGGYCRLTVTELPEERLPDRPTQAQIQAALEREGAAILSKLPKAGKVVAMCIEGKTMDSPQLAQQVSRWMVEGASDITFLVGGSFGMSQTVKDKAHLRLSMSPMTFPHHLARVMLLEQIYRGFSINANAKYHK